MIYFGLPQPFVPEDKRAPLRREASKDALRSSRQAGARKEAHKCIVPLRPASEGACYEETKKAAQNPRVLHKSRRGPEARILQDPLLAWEGRHHGVFVVVRVPAGAAVRDNREEDVPDEDVDDPIAGQCKSRPELLPATHENAGLVERSGKMSPWRGKDARDSGLQRTVAVMDFGFNQEDRSSYSQNNGPKKFGSKHVGPPQLGFRSWLGDLFSPRGRRGWRKKRRLGCRTP